MPLKGYGNVVGNIKLESEDDINNTLSTLGTVLGGCLSIAGIAVGIHAVVEGYSVLKKSWAILK